MCILVVYARFMIFNFPVLFGLLFWQSLMEYEEHEKRAWSVDFSRTEPSMLVSGSDDCKVILELFDIVNQVLLKCSGDLWLSNVPSVNFM